MKLSLEIKGIQGLHKEIRRQSVEVQRKARIETYASALDIQKKAKDNLDRMQAWDLGNLANSILVNRIRGGDTAEIFPEAPYGLYVEVGTKPHFPPLDALEGWAKRHGMDSAWPLALAISKRGTPAQPFLIPAWEDVVVLYFKRLRMILGQ